MYKIGVVTGTRAEYGLLKPLIRKMYDDSELELCLIVTGAHLEERFGYTCREIEEDGFHISHKIPMNLSNDTPEGICLSMAGELRDIAGFFCDENIDLLFLLGDRYETLMAAVAAMMFRIPIAHLHGGELTEGSIDDAIRHSISKMSSIHFTSTEIYAKRLRQMGENPGKVFCVGALGVENIKNIRFFDRDELCGRYSRLFRKPYMMVTYHPVTLESNMARKQFQNLLDVVSEKQEFNYIFTYANADAEGSAINALIDSYVSRHRNACVFKSMGQTGYLSALKYAVCMVGNSSSGIIEAPSFHIPTVNIGDRQTGRVCPESVISCGNSTEEIREALAHALSPRFINSCRSFQNPYEGNDTSERILGITKDNLKKGIKLQKGFVDL